jgi:hypothetical protein
MFNTNESIVEKIWLILVVYITVRINTLQNRIVIQGERVDVKHDGTEVVPSRKIALVIRNTEKMNVDSSKFKSWYKHFFVLPRFYYLPFMNSHLLVRAINFLYNITVLQNTICYIKAL